MKPGSGIMLVLLACIHTVASLMQHRVDRIGDERDFLRRVATAMTACIELPPALPIEQSSNINSPQWNAISYSPVSTPPRPHAYGGIISLRVPSSLTSLLENAQSASCPSHFFQPHGASSISVSGTTTSASSWESILLPFATGTARQDGGSTSSRDSELSSTCSKSGATPSAAYPNASPQRGIVYTGDITYYDVGLGSCGWISTPDEAVVAIPHGMMSNGVNPNDNPLCGTTITLWHRKPLYFPPRLRRDYRPPCDW